MSTEVYTDAVVADIKARYNAVRDEEYEVRTTVVQEIADELEVERASVIGKLVSLDVYVPKAQKAREATTVTKEALAGAVGTVIGREVPSFAKAKKDELEALWDFLRTSSDQFHADRGIVEPQPEAE